MTDNETPFGLAYPLGFLLRTALAVALACGVGLGVLRWVFYRELGPEYARAFYTLKNLGGFLAPALLFAVLAVLAVASVAVFGVALFASHKVAGPLFRLQRVAGHLAAGTLAGRVHLRAGDHGKVVAHEINRWVEARKDRLARVRNALAAAEAARHRPDEFVRRLREIEQRGS